jgi:hypothetical protein
MQIHCVFQSEGVVNGIRPCAESYSNHMSVSFLSQGTGRNFLLEKNPSVLGELTAGIILGPYALD